MLIRPTTSYCLIKRNSQQRFSKKIHSSLYFSSLTSFSIVWSRPTGSVFFTLFRNPSHSSFMWDFQPSRLSPPHKTPAALMSRFQWGSDPSSSCAGGTGWCKNLFGITCLCFGYASTNYPQRWLQAADVLSVFDAPTEHLVLWKRLGRFPPCLAATVYLGTLSFPEQKKKNISLHFYFVNMFDWKKLGNNSWNFPGKQQRQRWWILVSHLYSRLNISYVTIRSCCFYEQKKWKITCAVWQNQQMFKEMIVPELVFS